MQKKEKIYVNKITKNINNNEKIYYSSFSNDENLEINNTSKNINQKINEIFKSNNYVYKANVLIKTNKGVLKKTIIGKNRNFIITNENELIAIKDIIDIKYQEKNS